VGVGVEGDDLADMVCTLHRQNQIPSSRHRRPDDPSMSLEYRCNVDPSPTHSTGNAYSST